MTLLNPNKLLEMKNKETLLSILMLVLMVVFFTNDNKIIGLVTGIPLLIILIWSMISIQKSNVDSKLKRNMLIIIFPIISIIGRLYFQIMQ